MNYLICSLNSLGGRVIYPNFTNAEIAQDYVDSQHSCFFLLATAVLPSKSEILLPVQKSSTIYPRQNVLTSI